MIAQIKELWYAPAAEGKTFDVKYKPSREEKIGAAVSAALAFAVIVFGLITN